MIRMGALLVLAALLSEATVADAMVAKHRLGVFGTINGKKFKASNREGASDSCVFGIYTPATSTITFAALECRKRRRRQGAQRRNYKLLLLACAKYDQIPGTPTPPFELACPGSGYTETKTGRFGQPKSTTTWGSSFDYLENSILSSGLRMRVDAVDGTTVRGVIFGVFGVPVVGPASAVPAQISSEVQFEFPFQIH
jgi:hypothetical protein